MNVNLTRYITIGMTSLVLSPLGAEEWTLKSSQSENQRQVSHGFYMALDSTHLTGASDLPPQVIMATLSLNSPWNTTNDGTLHDFGLVVMAENNNTVLGYSSNTVTKVTDHSPYQFTMVAANGGSLILNTADTYRYVTVLTSTISTIANATQNTIVYNAVTVNNHQAGNEPQTTVSGDTLTITDGLARVSTMKSDMNPVDPKLQFISGANGSNRNTFTVAPYIANITLYSVPEPAATCLAALGLSALALRRKRA